MGIIKCIMLFRDLIREKVVRGVSWKDACQPTPLQCIDWRLALIVCLVLCPRHQRATVETMCLAFVCSGEQIRLVINLL